MSRSFPFDCSSRPAQLNTSSMNTELIVQVKAASSARLQATLDWLFKSSQPTRLIFTLYHVSCTNDQRVSTTCAWYGWVAP